MRQVRSGAKGCGLIRRICQTLREEHGIETLEWILIGALIVGVGLAVYPATLQNSLNTAINTVGTTINSQASSAS